MKNSYIFVHQNKTRVFFERALYAVLAPVRLVARLATRIPSGGEDTIRTPFWRSFSGASVAPPPR